MNFINEYPNFISEEDCSIILANIEQMPLEPIRKEANLKQYFAEYAISNLSTLETKNRVEEILELVDKKIVEYFQPVNGLIPYTFRREGFSILKTKSDGVPRHYDSEIMNNEDYDARCFLVLIYLNKLDIGGDLFFPYQKVVIKPEPGKLLIFPSSFAYPHSVSPYIGDDRLCIRLNYVINKESIKRVDKGPLIENK